MDPQPPAPAQLAEVIRDYLQAHPNAIDTERGIREWWLRDMQPPPSPQDVATAVAELVDAGELVSILLPGGRIALRAPRPSLPGPPGQPSH